ncbi:MAG: hypothetical protein EOP06_02820 [Proteobacteria bacterium]|nr:MAG: hypothetical protein EOP06_02820 [Pseudomonadota bacterium]
MAKIQFIKDLNPEIYLMLTDMAKMRLSAMSTEIDLQKIEMIEHPVPDDYIYGSTITLLQIAAKDLRFTVKVHFNISDVLLIPPIKKMKNRSPERELTAALDFFQEYCNLLGGAISTQIQNEGIVAGLSLPLSSSGFDEYIDSERLSDRRWNEYFQVFYPGFKFVLTSHIELSEVNLLSKFKYIPETDDLDIEIL